MVSDSTESNGTLRMKTIVPIVLKMENGDMKETLAMDCTERVTKVW